MQIEVKLSIDSAEGQARTAQTLENHHLRDECYYDFFFDFSYRALQERNSVLRLRVPCEPSCAAAAAAAAASASPTGNQSGANSLLDTTTTASGGHASNDRRVGWTGSAGGVGNYDPDEEYAAFLRACRGESTGATEDREETDVLSGSVVKTSGTGAKESGRGRVLPKPVFVPGAAGKLFLKQKNTIQHGHQMTFVAEDDAVPADVVEALVGLVPESLMTTGAVDSAHRHGTAAEAGANVFAVLSSYAQRRPLKDDGSGESPIARIVKQLSDIARVYTAATPSKLAGSKRGRSASQESDAHFTQVRFSAMGSRTAYTQRQRAVAESQENEEVVQEPQRRSGSASAAALPHVEAVGGFMTLRRIYAYTGVYQSSAAAEPTSPRDTEARQALRLRLDTSLLLPGVAIYELEVPKCGVAVDDVAAEVCAFLTKLAVPFHAGSESKYARYLHFLEAARDAEQDAVDVKLRLKNVNGYEEIRRNLQQLTHAPGTGAAGAAAAGAAAETPRHSQDKRYISNTEVDPGDGEDGDVDTWWQTNPSGYLQETNEDFFFDSPEQTLRHGQTFLRLRKQRHLSKYLLVLKAHQVFVGGQQNSLSSKLEVSEVVAHALVNDPTKFLREHRDTFAMMKTIWDEFGVRELVRAATFTTDRLTVPWWSAQSQVATMQRSWASASGGGATLAPQSQPIYASTSYLLSQQQQQQRRKDGGEVAGEGSVVQAPLVPPLLIHLDKTHYKLPESVKPARVPFSQGRPWADRELETYEIEVTSIEGATSAKAVIAELKAFLDALGVEWTVGVRSKLEQYYFFIGE